LTQQLHKWIAIPLLEIARRELEKSLRFIVARQIFHFEHMTYFSVKLR